MFTPLPPFAEITFRAVALVPPMMLEGELLIQMPSEPLPRATVPLDPYRCSSPRRSSRWRRSIDVNADGAVAGDDVSSACRRPADSVAGRAADEHAVGGVAEFAPLMAGSVHDAPLMSCR